jgi:hypothetical protein
MQISQETRTPGDHQLGTSSSITEGLYYGQVGDKGALPYQPRKQSILPDVNPQKKPFGLTAAKGDWTGQTTANTAAL